MQNIVRKIEEDSGNGIQLISQGIDQKSGSYLVGYANITDTNMLDGGMLIVSFEGDLIKNIELPFVPTYFLDQDQETIKTNFVVLQEIHVLATTFFDAIRLRNRSMSHRYL